jgi:hypothetical protein
MEGRLKTFDVCLLAVCLLLALTSFLLKGSGFVVKYLPFLSLALCELATKDL